MVLMQMQVSGLVCGADLGTVRRHRQGPRVALVWHWVTGHTAALPLHPVSLPLEPSTPQTWAPLCPWSDARLVRCPPSLVILGCSWPSRASVASLVSWWQAGLAWHSPCPTVVQGWYGIHHVPGAVRGQCGVPGAVAGLVWCPLCPQYHHCCCCRGPMCSSPEPPSSQHASGAGTSVASQSGMWGRG